MFKFILTLLTLLTIQVTFAQKSFDDEHLIKSEGYFDYYYDINKDKIFLKVADLDKEFLYVHSLSEGIGSNDIGIDRGQLGDGVVVKFIKLGNKIMLIQPNQGFRAITDNLQEKKSIEEAFAKSVLFGFDIEKEEKGIYVIDISDFLIRDAHQVSAKLKRANQGVYNLDKTKSGFHLERTKAFPKNVEFDVLLTFKGKPEGNQVRSVSPDAGLVSVYQHHSFVELPDATYTPRVFDPRSGGYPMTFMDFSTPVNEPIEKRWIYRHRLEKKNPDAVRSEAKKPIIYYLDPGTPEPIRSALLEGASWWNEAFEAAGYISAFQVKMLPEDADPMDLRYNVIQWVHRSTRGWSYGGSIADPRTGEIIKGHVSLGSLRIRQDFMIAQGLQAAYEGDVPKDDFALQMALARIKQLSAHEVGHTLGFAHNFAASTNGRASVMDYPHPWIQIKDDALDFSNAYASGIGGWDKILVNYAYASFESGESEALQKILDDAFDMGYRYISDMDARNPGGSNAYAHLWDNGNDIVKELHNVLEVRKFSINKFSLDNIELKQPYSRLEDVFVPLYFYHRYQTEAVSKMIGGWDYAFSVKGAAPTQTEQVAPEEQRKALDMLLKTVSVEHLMIPKSLLSLFPPRAIGYGRTRESFKTNLGVNFDPLSAAATASSQTFALLLHPERASRMILGKTLIDDQLSFSELLDSLFENTFKVQHKDNHEREVQNHINEQLLKSVFELVSDPHVYHQVKAIGYSKLADWQSYLQLRKSVDEQKMVDQLSVRRIDSFLSDEEMDLMPKTLSIPDGSPIGMD